jgi:hypothetical protein
MGCLRRGTGHSAAFSGVRTHTRTLLLCTTLGLSACAPESTRLALDPGTVAVGALQVRAVSALAPSAEPAARPTLHTHVVLHNAGPDTLYVRHGSCPIALLLAPVSGTAGGTRWPPAAERTCVADLAEVALAPGDTLGGGAFNQAAPLAAAWFTDGHREQLRPGAYRVVAAVELGVARASLATASEDGADIRRLEVPAGVLQLAR